MILVHVDDLLVFCPTPALSGVSAVLRVRFPLTDDASDYLGIEFNISANNAHMYQYIYVAKVVTETGFGGCRSMTAPLTTDYTAVDFDAPAGVDPNTASTINFPHVNDQLSYRATHRM